MICSSKVMGTNLGVYISLCMAKQIDNIDRSAYPEIRNISSIRHLLTTKATAQLLCSLVPSWLDYCNSLLIAINCDQMHRLQKVKYHAAKVVFRKDRHEHAKPLLKAHLWLLVKERIIFKTATFDFHFFHGAMPPDLSSCPSVYIPSRTLRSSSDEKGTHPEIIRVCICLKSCLSWFSRNIVYKYRSKCKKQNKN